MDKKRVVIVTENGQQIPVETVAGVEIGVMIPGDTTRESIELDVSESQFAMIKKQALTNKIPTAILKDKKVKRKLND